MAATPTVAGPVEHPATSQGCGFHSPHQELLPRRGWVENLRVTDHAKAVFRGDEVCVGHRPSGAYPVAR